MKSIWSVKFRFNFPGKETSPVHLGNLPASRPCTFVSICQSVMPLPLCWHTISFKFWYLISVPPSPPTNLGVTNILDRSVVIQFIPGFSGFSSISLWIVEAQMNNIELPSTWAQVYQYSDPGATAIRVPGLSPYMSYRLRINATNVAGMSNASQPTTWFNTLQATPSTPPPEVTVTTISETALQVRWQVCRIYFFLSGDSI